MEGPGRRDGPGGGAADEGDRTAVELGSSVDSAARAREAIRSRLTGVPDDVVETACLLADELVANVVLHVGTGSRMVIVRTVGLLRVEVSDHSSLEPARRTRTPTRLTGRGLHILDDLATEWGSTSHGGGKIVWFTLALPEGPT